MTPPAAPGATDVVLLRWPEEAAAVERLSVQGIPHLLLVAPEALPPDDDDCDDDCLVDWVRLPVDDSDLRARAAALQRRAARHNAGPELDGAGRLSFRGRWVSLSPMERALTSTLVERFGRVVSGEDLSRRAWPNEGLKPGAIRVHVLRLRRRIAPVGLQLLTVRGQGYVLEERG